ncbi:MAG: hypothetical protein FWH07_00075 [Oscillospiraceae bacterium]|nr:hypothetical protein [Oscillospiraceae bacterium]
MTKEEFDTFKRSIAQPAVKCKRGKISKEELIQTLFVTLGDKTIEETEKLIDKFEM